MSTGTSAPALGRRISQLREAAGKKQAELARQVTWSQAVLSRVEAGEREVNPDELEGLLSAIGTPEAMALGEILSHEWRHLPSPPLDHSDQALLWEAEQAACALHAQGETEGVRPAFLRRIEAYVEQLKHGADLLLRRDHNIAFIGAIGIGKSTAICKATGLEVLSSAGRPTPVLETGAGGITLCEVSLKAGPGYGVIVTPRSSEEVRADVADFADVLLTRATGQVSVDEAQDGQRGVPRELERAIRNLSGLQPSRSKNPDGKKVTLDPAKALAAELHSPRELTVEILSRMDLPRRDRREAWYDAGTNKGELAWLKDTFEQINNGRHSDFSLPAHVDLVVPGLLDAGDLSIQIIDTRGIDRVAARSDLEDHLLDSHTVPVLCSGFNDAPAQSIQHLLQRARDISNPFIDSHALVLVLPRPDEALAMKDEAGNRVESDEDGYELKAEQVEGALVQLGRQDLHPYFFNALVDDPLRLRMLLLDRVVATRDGFRRNLSQIIESAHQLVTNAEQQQVLEEQREASRQVSTWLGRHTELPKMPLHVHETLLAEIRNAHAATINAAVRREGEWYSLSYSYQLGFGARRVAATALRDPLAGFHDLAGNLAVTHPHAQELLRQAERIMDQAHDDLLKKMQVAGAALYRAELQRAQVLWMELSDEYGRGAGYRERVAGRQHRWFAEEDQQKVEQEVLDLLRREWVSMSHRVATIFDVD